MPTHRSRINSRDPSGMRRVEERTVQSTMDTVSSAITAAAQEATTGSKTKAEIQAIVTKHTDALTKRLSDDGQTWIKETAGAAVVRSRNLIKSTDASAGINLGPVGVSKEILDRETAEIGKYITDLTDEMQRTIIDTITKGDDEGLSADDIVNNVVKATGKTRNDADLLVRTSIMKTFNDTAADDYKKAGAVGYSLFPASDSRVCEKCRQVAFGNGSVTKGAVVNYKEPPVCPVHPRCRCTILPVFNMQDKAVVYEMHNPDMVVYYMKARI
jgi:SPP1 gp7 family putative phage head morphogenesis protein